MIAKRAMGTAMSSTYGKPLFRPDTHKKALRLKDKHSELFPSPVDGIAAKDPVLTEYGNLAMEKISQSRLNVVLDLVGIDEAFRKINKVTLIGNTVNDT